jgi:hypothetical protein
VKPLSPQDSATPGASLTFWGDSPSGTNPSNPSESGALVRDPFRLANRGAKSGPESKAVNDRGQPAEQGADSPPEEVLVIPPDTPTRRYRRETDGLNRDLLNRYDLIDAVWVLTRSKDLRTNQVLKVKAPADTPTDRFRVKDGTISKYKFLDGSWVRTWKEDMKTGAVTTITPPEFTSTKGRMTEVGIRVSDNGKPLAPREHYNNLIARDYADRGYINYAEILEAGHGCMACHITHFSNGVPHDEEINLNRYVMWSKILQGLNIDLAVGLVATPLSVAAEARLLEGAGDSVVHMTSAEARAQIMGESSSWGKIGGKGGVFALDASRVPQTQLMRHIVATTEGNMSAEIPISSGRLLQQFRRPPAFGPFSAFKRYSGVRSTGLGTVDLFNNRFIANEVFVDGLFRQATQGEIMRFRITQFALDYGIDMGIYTAGGVLYYAGTRDE